MEKEEIQNRLEGMVLRLHSANEVGVLSRVLPKAQFTDIDTRLENTLAYLSVCISDKMFEYEALEREYTQLKKMKG